MSKEGVIYSSGVDRRTELIIRAFCIKNDVTFAQFHKAVAHVVAGYGTLKMFDGKVREFNPEFEHFDRMVRSFMERETPDEYRRIPLLQRLFGRVYEPLTKSELDKIDVMIAQEEAEGKEPQREAPDVDSEDME